MLWVKNNIRMDWREINVLSIAFSDVVLPIGNYHTVGFKEEETVGTFYVRAFRLIS